MEFGEIFTDALKYPLSDYKKLLILGVIFVIASLTRILGDFGIYNNYLSLIWLVVMLILNILIFGYGISVIKTSIDLEDEIPDFDWVTNFVDGIKYVIVTFVYFIIPAIISGVIGFALGYGPITRILSQYSMAVYDPANATQANLVMQSIPQEAWNGLFTALAITGIIAIILFVIFGLFAEIAVCRLAKYDSFGEAFNFKEIYADLREIGILKVIGFIIVLAIIVFIIGLIIALITAIPYVGIIIACLVGNSFILLFSDRALGLLYSQV